VTGGGTGIGPSLAMGLARAGASVVLTGRRQSVLETAARDIQAQLDDQIHPSRRAFCSVCDITQFDQIAELVADAEYLTGIPPTILINNAGINVRQKAANLTSEHWQTSLGLMLTAPFMLARAMSSNMMKEKYGRIINLASLQSFSAFPNSIPYAAAKSGTLGLTRALAEAYSAPHGYENVTCNAIAPGYVKTDPTNETVFVDAELSDKLAAATLIGRNSVPEDLMGAVVFLSSPASSYITGQSLSVDGGFTALGLR
jgi:NAD(P)-dependent dehydrogenase (short-subunit alcohol dehydrogenase family)